MLVNLEPCLTEIERRKVIAHENNFEYLPQSDPKFLIENGIYRCACEFNFSFPEFLKYKDINPHSTKREIYAPTYHKSAYGIADSVEQIKVYYQDEINDPNVEYFIHVTPVFQDRINKSNDWRWHKWGLYIGVLDRQCEYLDDEDFGTNFKYVLCYSIHKLPN